MLARLKEYIDSKGISISAFEKSIGMSNASFGKSLKKGGAIGSDKLENILSVYPDINAEWLLTGKGEMTKSYNASKSFDQVTEPEMSIYKLKTDYFGTDKQLIPLYEVQASAGLNSLFSSNIQQVPLDYISVPNAPACDGAVYVRGDSMYPILKSGDIACYKTIYNLDNIYYGEMHLIDANIEGDQYLTFKYIQKSKLGSEYVCLVSHNEHYAPKDILKSNIRAIALVKLSIRYNTIS